MCTYTKTAVIPTIKLLLLLKKTFNILNTNLLFKSMYL